MLYWEWNYFIKNRQAKENKLQSRETEREWDEWENEREGERFNLAFSSCTDDSILFKRFYNRLHFSTSSVELGVFHVFEGHFVCHWIQSQTLNIVIYFIKLNYVLIQYINPRGQFAIDFKLAFFVFGIQRNSSFLLERLNWLKIRENQTQGLYNLNEVYIAKVHSNHHQW